MAKIKLKVLLAEMLAYADDDEYILTSAEPRRSRTPIVSSRKSVSSKKTTTAEHS